MVEPQFRHSSIIILQSLKTSEALSIIVELIDEIFSNKSSMNADDVATVVDAGIGLVFKVYSGRKPQEILDIDTNFLEQIGLDEHLSPTRKNGLSSLISSIKSAAKLELV